MTTEKEKKGMNSMAMKIEPFVDYQKGYEAGKSEAIKQVLEILRKGFIRNRDFIKIEAEIGDLAK